MKLAQIFFVTLGVVALVAILHSCAGEMLPTTVHRSQIDEFGVVCYRTSNLFSCVQVRPPESQAKTKPQLL